MIRIRFAGASVAALLAVLLVGCQKPDLSEMMKPPPRPAELDHLEMFVGDWEGTGEMTVEGSDEIVTAHGVETMSWDADKWVLVSRFEYEMGDDGKAAGMSIWTWDAKAEKYRIWSFDNYGYCEAATATYDEETKTWHFKSKSRNPVKQESFASDGTLKVIDNNTHEWSFTLWDNWKLMKLMEMKGTSRRR